MRSTPIDNAADAVRAIEMAVKQERLIRGEATDRTEVNNIETIIKREYERWMTPKTEPQPEASGDVDEHEDPIDGDPTEPL